MPQIRVLLGYQQGQVYPLDGQPLSIGRDPTSDIVLHPDSAASRRHAELVPLEGAWKVRDTQSVNGTLLNGALVGEEWLQDKDEVIIGDNVFVFENKDVDAARIAQAASHANAVESCGFQNRPEVQALVRGMVERTRSIETQIRRTIIGREDLARDILTVILCQGHLLLEGLPGMTKSALARTISEVLGLKFRRVQFTPDLTAADLTGHHATAAEATAGEDLRSVPGPIFCQLLLAEEINRTPPKTQAALIEAMQEGRVTVGESGWPMESPFTVIATKGSAVSDGAYPMTEAQLDAFMFSLRVEYPEEQEEELNVRALTALHSQRAANVLSVRQVLELQRAIFELPVSDHVVKYAVRLVRATRPADKRAPEFIRHYVHCGAGPRAAQYLVLGAKARAVIAGRLLVTPEDVRGVALQTLRHRLFTNFTAASENVEAEQLIHGIIGEVEEPEEIIS